MTQGQMHQSCVSTSSTEPGKLWDIDFSHGKALVYAMHCGDSLMINTLPKAKPKSWWINAKLPCLFGHRMKSLASQWNCRDRAGQNMASKTYYVQTIPGPMGAGVSNDLVHNLYFFYSWARILMLYCRHLELSHFKAA